MSDTIVIPLAVQRLLDRLDLHLDEPCAVEGCVHVHAGVHELSQGLLVA